MKKSFLLAGVILDIIVIALILITALNVVNITNKTNSFVSENKLSKFYKQARDILDQIDNEVNFYFVINQQGSNIPTDDKAYYITIALEPFVYQKESGKNNVFEVIKAQPNQTSKIQKVTIKVKHKQGKEDKTIISIDRLIF